MTYPPQYPYPGSEERWPKRKPRIPRRQSQSTPQTAAKPALDTPMKVVVAILAVAIAVLSVMAGMETANVWSKAISNEEAYGTQLSADRYDLQHPLVEINPKQEFTMKVSPEIERQIDERAAMWQCTFLCVYADADFTLPVNLKQLPHIVSGMSSRHHRHSADTHDLVGVRGYEKSGWGGYGQYWLVQWKDRDGEALAKPKVTYFTVRDKDAAALDKPRDPRLSVGTDGIVTAAWDAVNGAKAYRVYLFTYNPFHGIHETRSLVDTKATSLRMDTFDAHGLCGKDGQPQCDIEEQDQNMNNSLADLVEQSEDDAMECVARLKDENSFECVSSTRPDGYAGLQMSQMKDRFDPAMDVSQGWIGVTALDEQGHESPFSIVSLDSVAADAPVDEAEHVNKAADAVLLQRDVARSTLDEETQRAASSFHMTMLNGHTKTIYKDCRQKNPERYDEASAAMSGIEATCTVPGTKYTTNEWFRSVEDLEHQQAKVAAWRQEQTSTLLRPAIARTPEDAGTIDSRPIGSNGVEQYKPFGSSEYARYIAENLLAMHTDIDITQYADVRSAPAWADVVEETLMQNPYLSVMAGADRSGIKFTQMDRDGKQILHVRYDPQAKSRRDAFHTRVMQATAEITAGPTSEGAAQIEAYLARYAAPDADAVAAYMSGASPTRLAKDHPDAWTGGALTMGKGTDTSYALSFDAIADQIGLTSVLVTGWTANGPHIWNRVLLDGQWRDIDAARDDAGDHATDTYRLKDANTLDGHTTDTRWLLRASIDDCGGTGTKLEGDDSRTATVGLYDEVVADIRQRKSGSSWTVPSLSPQLALEIMAIAYLAFTIYFIFERRKGDTVARQAFCRRAVALVVAAACFTMAFYYGDMSNPHGFMGLLLALSVPPLAIFCSRPDAANDNRRILKRARRRR